MTKIQKIHSYVIGSEEQLSEDQTRQLVSCFEKPVLKAGAILGGRAAVSVIFLKDLGPVVVKNYTRGGVIRKFNRHTYLKFSRYRSQTEYELLRYLNGLGVCVPEPVAFAFCGSFFYHAWLVTREIRNARPLTEISRTDPDAARAAMAKLSQQVALLVKNHIHHVDLHPGNVLVDDRANLFIIDFDKAVTSPQNTDKLKKKYIRRWQRAVFKYQLPAVLNNIE